MRVVIKIYLPQWILKDEDYQPDGDRDYFISRSILRMMKILRSLRFQSQCKPLKKISAVAALCFTILLILLCVSTSKLNFLFCVLALELVILCTLDGQTIRQILQNSLIMAIFSALFVLPSLLFGTRTLLIMLPMKTFLTVTALGLLISSFRWHQITEALRFFRISPVVIFILDTTLRYIVLLGEISQDMLIALKLRSIGKNRDKKRAVSGILGSVFLKSREMSEDMYQAMCCRGFTGEYPISSKKLLKSGDVIFLVLTIGFIFLFLILEGWINL